MRPSRFVRASHLAPAGRLRALGATLATRNGPTAPLHADGDKRPRDEPRHHDDRDDSPDAACSTKYRRTDTTTATSRSSRDAASATATEFRESPATGRAARDARSSRTFSGRATTTAIVPSLLTSAEGPEIESGSSSLPRIAPGPALAAERCGMVFHVSAPTGSSEEIRRRVEGWRAAERREREVREAEGAPPVSVALEAGLELCQLDPHPPGTVDPVRAREDESARRAWDRLRRGLGWQPNATARP
jgi:hypothetical protein